MFGAAQAAISKSTLSANRLGWTVLKYSAPLAANDAPVVDNSDRQVMRHFLTPSSTRFCSATFKQAVPIPGQTFLAGMSLPACLMTSSRMR
jgi:hypothetical protein